MMIFNEKPSPCPILFRQVRACLAWLMMMCSAVMCVSCAGPTIEATANPPAVFALTLFTRTTTQRLTYFELSRRSELRYAGGLAALRREGELVTTLTPQQKQELWTLLIDGGLHEAGAGPLFPEAKEVFYDLALNTGGFDHIVRSVDDDHPGLKKVHDYLFKLQAQIRYNHPIVEP